MQVDTKTKNNKNTYKRQLRKFWLIYYNLLQFWE